MASLIEELIDVLEKEQGVYEELIPISEEKTLVIVENDVTSLQEITEKEHQIIGELNILENKRQEAMNNIEIVLGSKGKDLNLRKLVDLLERQPKEQKALAVLHDRLTDTIEKLVEVNNRNKGLIQQSLDMLEFNMNFIQSTRASQGSSTYNKGANSGDNNPMSTGMFDAKQ